ncbi:SGNH/GDSL hydrolase family protein [Arthrobacter sp. NPDC090010]|uniref:SGNH/GDSL hydrolase family protein n=1 Tax=Arthrobacter sp. NPDC090010 TaxID=3363942 RepID=UPI0037F40ED7
MTLELTGPVRFVALGDSFTEGVGDVAPSFPHGCRGWADRVAQRLSGLNPETRYANLAVRGRRLDRIVEEQLSQALDMQPTLVSLYAGGNDLLMARLDLDDLLRRLEQAVLTLRRSGAQVLLFTGYNVPLSPLLEPFKLRNAVYNTRVRRIARELDCVLVDYWCFERFQDRTLWAPDRLHMSVAGHEYMADKVLELLGLGTGPAGEPGTSSDSPEWSLRERIADDVAWLRRDFSPWLSRKIRGVSSGDALAARWPRLSRVDAVTGLPLVTPEPVVPEVSGPFFARSAPAAAHANEADALVG